MTNPGVDAVPRDSQSLLAGQVRALEMIASGAALPAILDELARMIEAHAPGMLASILLLDADGVHLRHGAAPSLPAAYVAVIDGQPIGEAAGSCGTAAVRREPVIVEDVTTDPLWAVYRVLAAAHGLRACWSTPIFDSGRRVLGTFALYFREPARPGDWHRQLIAVATHTAAIAIERARSLAALRDSEAMFRAVFETAAIGMSITDMEGRLQKCNAAFARMLGYAPEELCAREFRELTHPDDVARNLALYRALTAGETDHFQMEKRYLRKDGSTAWAQLTVSRAPTENGVPVTVGMMEDIGARKRAELELRESEQRYRGILEAMTIGFVTLDRDWRFNYVNPRAGRILARDPASLLGRTCEEAFPESIGTPFLRDYNQALRERANLRSEYYFEPWKRWLELRIEPTAEGASLFFQDVTARKASESRIQYLATHHGLTGLPNRNLIHDHITQAIAHAVPAGGEIAVACVNLDRFKVINDGFGHTFGDALLKETGERLAAQVRGSDTVAHLGADAFLVLLAEPRDGAETAAVTRRMLEAIAQPCAIGDREIHATASIGVSVFPRDGGNAEVLISGSEFAMFRAKQHGGDTCLFFTREMSEETRRRAEIETGLRTAVNGGQLHLVYQPKVELSSGAITGCEALLRWNHPALGPVPPAAFIPVAEDSGLIVPIGDWVLRTACAQSRAWLAAGLPPLTVSVNISLRQFLQRDVVGWVAATLAETGLAPHLLELELTESLMAHDVENVIATVDRLKAEGVKVSIDDFGTGYSSLSYLKRFRVDTLKIDQSFIRHMLTESGDATIALAVISLAHNLGMTALAEGVETGEHCRVLRRYGCDAIQGYYFSRPLATADFEALLKSGRRLAALEDA